MQNYPKRNVKNVALNYLANLYYDREFLTWDKFEDMAIVFHQNSRLESCWNRRTRKHFEKMSLYLIKILEIIKRDSNKATWLYFDEDSKCISLGQMDGLGHLSHFNEIAALSLKMRECMKDRTFVNEYIFSLKEKVVSQVMFLKCSYAIDESMKEKIFVEFELLMQKSDNHPEDIFRIVKNLKCLLKKNQFLLKQKEIDNVKLQEQRRKATLQKVNQLNTYFYGEKEEKEVFMQKANAVLERMYALLEMTQDETCKMVLSQDIMAYNGAICSENMELIQAEMERFEEIFETSTRKSKRL